MRRGRCPTHARPAPDSTPREKRVATAAPTASWAAILGFEAPPDNAGAKLGASGLSYDIGLGSANKNANTAGAGSKSDSWELLGSRSRRRKRRGSTSDSDALRRALGTDGLVHRATPAPAPAPAPTTPRGGRGRTPGGTQILRLRAPAPSPVAAPPSERRLDFSTPAQQRPAPAPSSADARRAAGRPSAARGSSREDVKERHHFEGRLYGTSSIFTDLEYP